MWRPGLVAPRHVGSSRTRAQTRVPCIGRQILNHCATREVQGGLSYNQNFSEVTGTVGSLHVRINSYLNKIRKDFVSMPDHIMKLLGINKGTEMKQRAVHLILVKEVFVWPKCMAPKKRKVASPPGDG